MELNGSDGPLKKSEVAYQKTEKIRNGLLLAHQIFLCSRQNDLDNRDQRRS